MQKLSYRHDIDGLRAIAVLLVVVYHAFPALAPSGFVGVDVFFVISGYLITGILLQDLSQENFSFLEFYGRRFRRIVPTLWVVLLGTMLLGWFVLLSSQFKALGLQTLAGATFTTNILSWRQPGYFDVAVEKKALMHLWSLAVEEQFYLLWPAMLAFCFWRGYSIGKILLALLVGSFVMNVFLVKSYPAFVFFFLLTRWWELMVGAALAYFKLPKALSNSKNLTGWMALVLLVVVTVKNRSVGFPGWWALCPTASAFLFLSSGPEGWINRNILSQKLPVFLGQISYPLYLWHWPLLYFSRTVKGSSLSWPESLLSVSAALLLSWLTWIFVEKPIRFRLFRHLPALIIARRYVYGAIAALALMTGTGYLMYSSVIISRSHLRAKIALGGLAPDDFPGQFTPNLNGICFLMPRLPQTKHDEACYQWAPGKKRVLIWGDSYAASLHFGLAEFYRKYGNVEVNYLTAASCPPILGPVTLLLPNCEKLNDFIYEQIKKDKVDVVVLAGNWISYSYFPTFKAQANRVINGLKEAGVKTVLVNQMPVWDEYLPDILEREFISKGRNPPTITDVGLDPKIFKIEADMIDKFSGVPTRMVSPLKILCTDKKCLTTVSNNWFADIFTIDSGHFTQNGSRFMAARVLAPVISPLLQLETEKLETKASR